MKYLNSLKGALSRHRDSRKVKRKGVMCIINKKEPRFKVKQGKKRAPNG